VGAIVDLSGRATHRTIDQSLTIVERLAHRAGSDALGTTGDGVGIMTQIPHDLFIGWAEEEVSTSERREITVSGCSSCRRMRSAHRMSAKFLNNWQSRRD
jgi:glutamate synthase (ferredoxin)